MSRIYVETEVDLSDIDEDDLVDYLENLGYTIIFKNEDKNSSVHTLYLDWLESSPEEFTKKLKKFFSEILDIHVL